MYKHIRVSRVIINILFYVFYVFLVSVIFSFVFPAVLRLFGQPVLDPNNPVFDKIQIIIIILTLIISVIYRKYFYLPIINWSILNEENNPKKDLELEHDLEKIEKEKNKSLKKWKKNEENISSKASEKEDELDIKVWKEIK